MKELNLAVYTGPDGATITFKATFENQQQAIEFHEGLSRLCRAANTSESTPSIRALWPTRKLIGG